MARDLLGRAARFMVVGSQTSIVIVVLLVASLVAWPGAARAQTSAVVPLPPAPPLPVARALTLPEALAYAHEHQPALRRALSRVSAQAATAGIPSGHWLPQVAVTAQLFAMTANNTTATYLAPAYMDIPRIGATQSTATGSLSPYASTLVGAGLTQEVFDFGRIGAQRAAQDLLVDVEKHGADQARLDVDFGVEESYLAVLGAKAIVAASEQAYERARVHRDFAKRGVDSGLRSPIELTRAEADLARFDVGRIRARGGVAVAQTVLAAAIGAPDAAIDVTGQIPTRADMPTLDQAVKMADAKYPALMQALADLRAAEEQTRAVGAELRPELYLSATLTGRAGGAPPSGGAPVPNGDGWIPDVPNWSAGLVLSWPLFDGVIAARRNAARATEQVRKDAIDQVREQELSDVRRAYVQVEVARTAMVGLQNAVVAAQANYAQADARFRAGIGNAVELADAEAVRTDAEIQFAVGQFEVARARASFGRLIAESL